MRLLDEAAAVATALLSNDAWAVREALATNGAWVAGAVATVGGGALVLALYRLIPVLDRHLERTVMVTSYLVIAAVIFVEVIRRFALSEQAPWSTTLPPFLFLIMTWFGCAYNVRLRTHLAFSELRAGLPRTGQMLCLGLDAALWLAFSCIVITTSARITANSASNFQFLLGTDNVMQWWFLASVPLSFTLLAARALENLMEDIANYRAGAPLMHRAVIGAD